MDAGYSHFFILSSNSILWGELRKGRGSIMDSVLSYLGILLIVASVVVFMMTGHIFIFQVTITVALGSIALGVAKISKLLQEIELKLNQGDRKVDKE